MEESQQEFFKEFNIFQLKMKSKLIQNFERKGIPTKETLKCWDSYLLSKLQEHLELKHYEDCANYCFLLRLKNGE
jgi:hypothetical protein